MREVCSARMHWDKGHLKERLLGETPTPLLMDLVEVAAAGLASCEAYFSKPEKDRV